MFNNIFCEMGKKVILDLGIVSPGPGLGKWGRHPNFFLEVQLQYLLGYPNILLG